MSFKIRTTAPTSTDKNWIHTSKGGKNSCILIAGNSVIPNCVGYAWGRFMEILGSTPKLSRANAEDWYGHTSDGYKRGQTPELGAVICWRKGKTGTESDGAGHVAIVEQIYSDDSIMISESGYNSFRFRIKTLKKPYLINGYSFQGFIYNPAVKQISVDGYWGIETTKATQMFLGSIIDGQISNQLITCKKYLPNAVTNSWQFNSKGIGGSPMVKKLQICVGADVDGYAGFETISKLQMFLQNRSLYSGKIDGIAGILTVTGWQKYLNIYL